MRAHYFTPEGLIVSRDGSLYFLGTTNKSLKEFVSLPCVISGNSSLSNILARLLRSGVHHVLPLSDGTLIVVTGRKFIKIDLESGNIQKVFSIQRGARPLFLCSPDNKNIFWGEYFGNAGRGEIHIYSSTNFGSTFNTAYTFPRNTIRHVHGIFHDPYDGGLWATTGDTDGECGIWASQDGFRTIEKVAGNNQQTRALQLLFTKRYVYFGSDAPEEKNHIYRIEKNSGSLEKLQSVDNSIFWGCKVGDSLFFSTAVEPSKVNDSKHACIWGSKNGDEWMQVASFKKDFLSMKYFQYGQILFPAGENNTGSLWFSPFATHEHLTLHQADVSEIF